jgi:hypothetical protein
LDLAVLLATPLYTLAESQYWLHPQIENWGSMPEIHGRNGRERQVDTHFLFGAFFPHVTVFVLFPLLLLAPFFLDVFEVKMTPPDPSAPGWTPMAFSLMKPAYFRLCLLVKFRGSREK